MSYLKLTDINYSQKERQFVHDNAGILTSKQIGEILGRTKSSVDQFKWKNGISKRKLGGKKDIQIKVAEMKAILRMAELTDSPIIRKACKVKLAQLSEIPKNNFYSLENTLRRTKNGS